MSWPQEVPDDLLLPHLEPPEGNSNGHLPADTMEVAFPPDGVLGQLQVLSKPSALSEHLPSPCRLSLFMTLLPILLGEGLGTGGGSGMGEAQVPCPAFLDVEGVSG